MSTVAHLTGPSPDVGDRMRDVLGSYPTGVVVVTAFDADGKPQGMVIGSFTSVSLDPPLVGFLPMRTSRSFESIRGADRFAVNILASDQEDLCRLFSSGAPDRFERAGWRRGPGGAPILDGVVGWLECSYESIQDAGDHLFVLGRVQDLEIERDALPLLFFQRGYGRFSSGSFVSALGIDMIEAVRIGETLRDEATALARVIGAECSVVAPVAGDAVFVAVGDAETAQPPRVGTRVPIVAPLGSLLVGSVGAPTEDEWIASLGRVDEDVSAFARRQLETARSRGWSISLTGGRSREDFDQLVEVYSADGRTLNQERRFRQCVSDLAELHEPDAIAEDEPHNVLTLTAPVRNANGGVIAVLRLSGLPQGITGTVVNEWVAELLAATERAQERLNA